jgi:diguanylate cyclase (GGDEF)-like protein/PAS domain S-box-containing protein
MKPDPSEASDVIVAPTAPGAFTALEGEVANPWRLALESSGAGVWDWNLVTGDQTHSLRWKEMLGYADHEIGPGEHEFFSRLHPDDLPQVQAASAAYLDGRASDYTLDVRMRHKDGQWVWILVHGMVVNRDAQGKPVRLIGTHTDITQRKLTEERLRALNQELADKTRRLQDMQAMSRIGGWELDLVNGSLVWTDEMYRIMETTPQAYQPVVGSARGFMAPASHARLMAAIAQARPDDPPLDMELELITAKGRTVWVQTVLTLVWAEGKQVKRLAMVQDITERRNAANAIWQQAHFDPLTGLPNRRMLRDRLEQEIRKSRRDHQQLAILFIDLDHFKEVNDTLGHDYGDLLLVEAARRIRAGVRETDTVARMGGDEFTVLLTELGSTSQLEGVLQKLLDALAAVFQLREEQVFVSGSVGVTIYPADGTDIENLYKNADQAMYAAKTAGRNRFSFFTPALQEAVQTRVRLVADLRIALAEGQFRVEYQPIVDLATGGVRKAEALLRWQHPTRGLMSPADFIPAAEASGLITGLGEWIFREAVAQVAHWRTSLHPQFQISVNKSPVQFQHQPAGGESWIEQLTAKGLPGDSIVAEITEGLLLGTSVSVTDRLHTLRAGGVQVSLDDFGTGYSSLSYLHKFEIDFVKIDKAFVANLSPSSTDLALCKAIIVMAHELGMKVVAEGVETAQQRDLLRDAGCDFGQGYLFAAPMPAAEFEAFCCARSVEFTPLPVG